VIGAARGDEDIGLDTSFLGGCGQGEVEIIVDKTLGGERPCLCAGGA